MSKCAIVGEKAIRDLIARYEGIGKPLTNDEREILLFHLYNERRRLRDKVVAVRDTIERRINSPGDKVPLPEKGQQWRRDRRTKSTSTPRIR